MIEGKHITITPLKIIDNVIFYSFTDCNGIGIESIGLDKFLNVLNSNGIEMNQMELNLLLSILLD